MECPLKLSPRYHNLIRIAFPIAILLVSVLYLFLKKPAGSIIQADVEQANAGLNALREWMVWIVALSGAAIGGMATLLEKVGRRTLTEGEKTIGLFTLCLYGLSILVAVFVAGFLPDAMLRINPTSTDIFHMSLISWSEYPYIGPIVTVAYSLFSFGAINLSLFVALRLRSA